MIHTDFERGFIKAEVVAFDDFKSLTKSKSMSEVRRRAPAVFPSRFCLGVQSRREGGGRRLQGEVVAEGRTSATGMQ